MRLKYIKLSGFKSFVDTTKVSLPANLIGVVGPNGCGKSNVIDAIRWVMGESSAKTLRGDSMEDVIFNGSTTRKPVSKASVELVFDNKTGKAPGAYAKYNEISIKRELARESGSKYFINGIKSRRKDINDIFLGTGLGPRSYSIIEQGMVSRIVESKPEELRNLIEEAAGISKYKARRRETENRIRHTQENLSRVDDIVGELETQLRRLKRQASSAERYKNLKEELRTLEEQIAVLKWFELDKRVEKQQQDETRLQTELERQIADQRGAETNIEAMRDKQVGLTEALNKVQAEYYQLGGEVSALEQKIQSAKESRLNQQNELQRLQSSKNESQQHLLSDERRLAEIDEQLKDITPRADILADNYQIAHEAFSQAEAVYQEWQSEWETLAEQASEPERQRGVQTTLVDNHRSNIQAASERQRRAQSLLSEIEGSIDVEQIDAKKTQAEEAQIKTQELEEKLAEFDESIGAARAEVDRMRDTYNNVRNRLQGDSARLQSLQEIRERLLGDDDGALQQWKAQLGLENAPRLLDGMQVEAGWELAVESLMADQFTAICVDDLADIDVSALGDFSVSVFENNHGFDKLDKAQFPRLLEKLNTKANLTPWLSSVFAAQDLQEALKWQSKLAPNELIVTKQGQLLGTSWLSVGSGGQTDRGVLAQEAEIESLTKSVAGNQAEVEKLKQRGEAKNVELKQLEVSRNQLRIDHREHSRMSQDVQREYARTEAKNAEWINRREQLTIELTELAQELMMSEEALQSATIALEEATKAAHSMDKRRAELMTQRDGLREALEQARGQELVARQSQQDFQVQQSSLVSNQTSLKESITRLTAQLEVQLERTVELETLLSEEDLSQVYSEELRALLDKRIESEKKLTTERSALADHETMMRDVSQKRSGFDQQAQTTRASLEQVRIAKQELITRRNTFAEQLDVDYDAMTSKAEELDNDLRVNSLEKQIEDNRQKIDKIGPVNLVAIDEFEECSERAQYLTSQKADLTEALETLQKAINKIDRETRSRFKDTFEALNKGFKAFFPKLFGDGEAHLVLTDNDMLTTGVGVMARPPGKRNSTIHLLSGGEKALTAVALIFAFFELNPAPFCVLDEVDAPLDDANVERYSRVLKQLGEHTQLLFITHNKITMEVANILVGVTMAEPGASRIVQVDVEEAAAMIAS